jgi:hypothetical protein
MMAVRVKYPRYRRPLVMAQNYGYEGFPPAANGWTIIHVVPDMAPPLQAEEDQSTSKKELFSGAIHAFTFPPYDEHG